MDHNTSFKEVSGLMERLQPRSEEALPSLPDRLVRRDVADSLLSPVAVAPVVIRAVNDIKPVEVKLVKTAIEKSVKKEHDRIADQVSTDLQKALAEWKRLHG